jgi:ribonuclease P protein component
MLPSNRRLTTEFFDKTIAGRAFHSPSFTIKAIKPPEDFAPKSRFAVASSKKYFKTAVSRNKARRRTYSALASVLPDIMDGFFLIIMPKPETSKLTPTEFRLALLDILAKTGIMKKVVSKVK